MTSARGERAIFGVLRAEHSRLLKMKSPAGFPGGAFDCVERVEGVKPITARLGRPAAHREQHPQNAKTRRLSPSGFIWTD